MGISQSAVNLSDVKFQHVMWLYRDGWIQCIHRLMNSIEKLRKIKIFSPMKHKLPNLSWASPSPGMSRYPRKYYRISAGLQICLKYGYFWPCARELHADPPFSKSGQIFFLPQMMNKQFSNFFLHFIQQNFHFKFLKLEIFANLIKKR